MLCRDNDGLVMENKCNILRYIIDMQLMRFGGVRQHAITNYFSHRIKYMTLFSIHTLAKFSFHYHFFPKKYMRFLQIFLCVMIWSSTIMYAKTNLFRKLGCRKKVIIRLFVYSTHVACILINADAESIQFSWSS